MRRLTPSDRDRLSWVSSLRGLVALVRTTRHGSDPFRVFPSREAVPRHRGPCSLAGSASTDHRRGGRGVSIGFHRVPRASRASRPLVAGRPTRAWDTDSSDRRIGRAGHADPPRPPGSQAAQPRRPLRSVAPLESPCARPGSLEHAKHVLAALAVVDPLLGFRPSRARCTTSSGPYPCREARDLHARRLLRVAKLSAATARRCARLAPPLGGAPDPRAVRTGLGPHGRVLGRRNDTGRLSWGS